MSTLKYLGKRISFSILVLVVGMSFTFALVRFGPVDPAAAIVGNTGSEAQQQTYEQVRSQLGLAKPIWQHYLDFMADMFTFQFGQSWVLSPGTPAVELLLIYGPRTLWLAFWAVLIPIFLGIPLGFLAGLNANSYSDYSMSMFGIVWRAMPNFWLAVILLAILSQSETFLFINWKTSIVETSITGSPDLNNLSDPQNFMKAFKKVIPASIVLGSASMGSEIRISRTAVIETMNSNYVEFAKSKGIHKRMIVWKHIFRNALVPLVPTITNEAFLLVGGSVIVESVFGINGLGYLFLQATLNGDLMLVAVIMFVFILVIVGMNIIQDILYVLIDPRVSYKQ